ncbi:hypothetical protein BJ684DRAFT_1103, partial [Piptocephalis cylindrospora]
SQDDLYAVLGVSKKANTAEIHDAYRHLSRTFHPDKHPNMTEAASRHFKQIQHAADILLDEKSREVYDTYGEGGLAAGVSLSKWTTAEAFRREFERMARERLEEDVDNLVRSRGEVEIQVDTSLLLDPYSYELIEEEEMEDDMPPKGVLRRMAQVLQMALKHSYDIPLDESSINTLTLAGHSTSRNGMGDANVEVTWRRSVIPFLPSATGELTMACMTPRFLQGRLQYSISANAFANAHVKWASPSAPPPLAVTTGRRLGKYSMGHISYRTGSYSLGPWGRGSPPRHYSALGMGLHYGPPGKQNKYAANVQVSPGESFLHSEVTRPLSHGVTARADLRFSSHSRLTTSIGTETKLTKHWTLSWNGQLAMAGGTTFTLGIQRLGQGLSIPIILSPEFSPQLFLKALMIPSLLMEGLERWILGPQRRERRRIRREERREAMKEKRQKDQQEALEARELLTGMVERKRVQESERHGLVVLMAAYGPKHTLESFLESTKRDESKTREQLPTLFSLPEDLTASVIDATLSLQAMVQESRLLLPVGPSKSSLPGLYDPCYGEAKSLLILYVFRGQSHLILSPDRSSLMLPQRSHQI